MKLTNNQPTIIESGYGNPDNTFTKLEYVPMTDKVTLKVCSDVKFNDVLFEQSFSVEDLVDMGVIVKKNSAVQVAGTGTRRRRTAEEIKYNIGVDDLAEFRASGMKASEYAQLKLEATK